MATGRLRVVLVTRHIRRATHNIKCSSRCKGRCNMPSRCSTQFKTCTMAVLRVSATRSCKPAHAVMSRRAIRRRRRLPMKVRASERTRALAMQSRLRRHRPLHPPLQYRHRRTILLTLLLVLLLRATARIATAAQPKAAARARNRTAYDAENGPPRRRIMRTGSFRSSSQASCH